MGGAFIFPHTVPLVVPDQKVTAGALNEAIMRW